MTRALSPWGWGYEDRFPDVETRRVFARELQTLTGMDALDIVEPCPLEEAQMPEPRIAAPSALASIATTERRARATRAHGRAYRDIVRGFYGDYASAPDVVLTPTDEDHVRIAMEWAERSGVALVPYGGGTSVVGGVEVERAERFAGVACLDLRELSRVLEVDALSGAARIQAGATGPILEEQLKKDGLSLRFFPQSFELSTLGGWIATRAGGHFATVETHIDDLVESIRMLTPRGVLESRRLPASGAGPSPDRLLLGSEGALGVITEAWVRVRPRPLWRARASVRFREWKQAVAAIRAVAQSGLGPSNCRLLDQREAMINRVATDGTHVLLLGFESADHPVDAGMARALEIATDHDGVCKQGPTLERTLERDRESLTDRWRAAFVDAPHLVNSMVSLGVIADTFETACTWDRLDALHGAVVRATKDAMRRVAGNGLITCRFTHAYPDGVAPYFTFIAPARRGSELSQWAEIKSAASEAILANGGTITHHHAVGRMHRPWAERQRPALFTEVLRAAKRTLDPHGVLNPGVLLADEA
ncbi:MAG: FAD-binding oxidoreductase [Sandaracinaceae bacterium]